MTSQVIGNNKVALFLEEGDLAERGLCKLSSEGKELKRLVVEALKNSGIQSDGNMEIEIFNGKEGILIFAVVGIMPSIRYMVFDQVEALIEAAGVLLEFPLHSKLTYYEGRYWLEIKDFDETAEKTALQLGEFGRHLSAEEYREYIITEYGTVIEKENALRTFQRYFHKRPA